MVHKKKLFLEMKEADQKRSVACMAEASLKWFKFYPGQTFVDLEEWLRKNHFITYLFASKIRCGGTTLRRANGEQDPTLKYAIWFSCRPAPYALQEVLQHWKTYEENLEALEYAGMEFTLTDDLNQLVPAEGHCVKSYVA
jgi:hypothetical protein